MSYSLKLSNDLQMPVVGFGTWNVTPDQTAEEIVRTALEAGYRHIDTAKIYGNEQGVGQAIKAFMENSGVPREEIFVTTKLWNSDHGYDDARRAIDGSLQRLGLDYVNLYLVHWPDSDKRGEAWKAMEQIYADGKARSIGVSNYTIRHLKELMDQSDTVPMVNQVEFHPFIYEYQRMLLAFCEENDIVVEAYSPLARSSKAANERIQEIADGVGKTPSQVILRWCLQHGTAPLPRSKNPDHITENLDVFGFELDELAMGVLNSLSDGERVTSDPEEVE